MVAQRLARLGGDWRTRREMLQYLAFRMHSEGQDAGREIGEQALIEWLCTYLCQRRHMTPERAETLVTDLGGGGRQRGGLLEERVGLYRFNPQSLQEFLTARYLAEVERDVERIAVFFEAEERLTDAWWRETILLTGGYLHLTASDVATQFIHRLAHLESTQPPQTAAALAAAELASATFLEWGSAEATQRPGQASDDSGDRSQSVVCPAAFTRCHWPGPGTPGRSSRWGRVSVGICPIWPGARCLPGRSGWEPARRIGEAYDDEKPGTG